MKINPTIQMNEDEDFLFIDINNELQFYGTTGLLNLKLTNFLNKNNTYYGKEEYRVNVSPIDFFKLISQCFKNKSQFNFIQDMFFIFNKETFVTVFYDLFEKDISKEGGLYKVSINSTNIDTPQEIINFLEKSLLDKKINSVNWAFMTRDGNIVTKEMRITDINTNALDEFYPWIPEGLDDYYNKYINSEENVLLLIGEPGTGKTTFIRNMLFRNKLTAVITYDEKLMKDDQFFLDYITGDNDVLIIEDADTMILEREKENNTLLAKILNVSDGLIKNINKKIIFSTNITDKMRIDTALTRPGRCFDVIDFRSLSYEEALVIKEKMNLTKELVEHKNYTLAELLSDTNRSTKKEFKVGFYQ